MPKGQKTVITRCIGLREDQIAWYERNDINFSKLVRRLVDGEMVRRESTGWERQLDNGVDLFEYVKGLVIEENKDSQNFNPDRITLGWLKTLIASAFPCLGNHYALLTDKEKRILENDGINTGLYTEE